MPNADISTTIHLRVADSVRGVMSIAEKRCEWLLEQSFGGRLVSRFRHRVPAKLKPFLSRVIPFWPVVVSGPQAAELIPRVDGGLSIRFDVPVVTTQDVIDATPKGPDYHHRLHEATFAKYPALKEIGR